MGAGAGYSITVSNCVVNKIADISPMDISLSGSNGWITATIKTDIKITATLNAEAYYDGSGNIDNVDLTITSVNLNLGFGNGYNAEILTAEAIDKYEEQFDADIESLWKELTEVVTADDIDLSYIKSELSDGRNYNGESETLSWGWVHATFSGEFTLDDVDGRSGYNNVESATMHIMWDAVTEFIDAAVTGDNVEYTVFVDNDIIDTFDTEEKAIQAAKDAIESDIKSFGIDNVDFEAYTVERSYYYLNDGGESTYEYETDFDNSEVVWTADADDFV
jgi:hypothetical protein